VLPHKTANFISNCLRLKVNWHGKLEVTWSHSQLTWGKLFFVFFFADSSFCHTCFSLESALEETEKKSKILAAESRQQLEEAKAQASEWKEK